MSFAFRLDDNYPDVKCPYCRAGHEVDWITEYGIPYDGTYAVVCCACGLPFKFECHTETTYTSRKTFFPCKVQGEDSCVALKPGMHVVTTAGDRMRHNPGVLEVIKTGLKWAQFDSVLCLKPDGTKSAFLLKNLEVVE